MGEHHSFLEEIFEHLLAGLGLEDRWLEAITHLISDFLSIIILFFVVTAVVSLFSSLPFLSRARERLKNAHGPAGYLTALAAGMLSPFCSCTIIPVFAGFLAVGVPSGYLFTFLTAASMLGLSTLVTLAISADAAFFIFYISASLAICLAVGLVPWLSHHKTSPLSIDLCGCECSCGHDHVHNHDILHSHSHEHEHGHEDGHERASIKGSLAHSIKDTLHVLREIWPWLLASLVLSSALSFLTPEGFLAAVSEKAAVPFAALIGIPVHSDIFSALPFFELFSTLSRGAAGTFMMFAMSFSIPGTVLLLKILDKKTVFRYTATLLGAACIASVIAVLIL